MNKQNIILDFEDLKSTYKSSKYYELAVSKYKHILPLPASEELTRITACLLTDGFMDIRPRLKSIYYGYVGFFSKSKEELKDFGKLVYNIFGIKGQIKEWGKRKFGESNGYLIINSILTRILNKIDIPGGDKVGQEYSLPKWILNSNRNIKATFLRQLFDCEGSINYSNNRKRWEIKYSMYKSRDLLDNCKQFLDDVRNMLNIFGINSNLQKKEAYVRNKDDLSVIGLCIRIDDKKSIINYAKQIGFNISYKQERLYQAIKFYKQSGPAEI